MDLRQFLIINNYSSEYYILNYKYIEYDELNQDDKLNEDVKNTYKKNKNRQNIYFNKNSIINKNKPNNNNISTKLNNKKFYLATQIFGSIINKFIYNILNTEYEISMPSGFDRKSRISNEYFTQFTKIVIRNNGNKEYTLMYNNQKILLLSTIKPRIFDLAIYSDYEKTYLFFKRDFELEDQ